MTDFYDRLRGTATRLLAPTDKGGKGQGSIVLVRLIPGPTPANEWDPPAEPTPQRTPLSGAASGVGKQLIGAPVENSGQIIATDRQVIVSPPEIGYTADTFNPTDILELDGSPVTILSVQNIPAVGTVCAIKFIVR